MSLVLAANGRTLGQARQLRWTLEPDAELVAFCGNAEIGDAQRALVGKRVELEIVDPRIGERLVVSAIVSGLVEVGDGFNVHANDFANLRGTGVLKALFGCSPPRGRGAGAA